MAAGNASITGKVLDASGGVMPGVKITLTNTATGAKSRVTTGSDGTYAIEGMASGNYTLSAVKSGFLTYSRNNVELEAGQRTKLDITLNLPGLVQSVVVRAKAPQTSVTTLSIPKGQIQAVAGPIGGSAQALTAAPGINIYGYGGIAATARSEVVVRGIKTGWSSVNGDIEKNGIMFLLDGIPMNNMIAANGQWEPTQLPIMPMISEVHVIYGPGDPADRWFDSLGGTVNYVPVQPSKEPGLTFSSGASYGSYGTRSGYLTLRTGIWKGWSAVLSSGITANHTFRTKGWEAPGQGWAGYGKVRKYFKGGDFSVGYYVGREHDYRPNFIPLNPISQDGQAITTEGVYGVSPGVSADAPLYSQPTSGYYSSFPGSLWFKLIRVNSDIVYSKVNLKLAPHLTLHNRLWYRHGYRLHYRVDNYFGPGPNTEWYDPTSDTYGNQAYVNWDMPRNEVTAGGYFMHDHYHTIVSIYSKAMGTTKTNPFGFNSQHLYNNYGQLYVQDRIDVLPNLILTPGIAEQLFQTSFYNSGFADFPQANPNTAIQFSSTPDSHKSFARFSPSVGVAYMPFHRLGFHGNYAETYQNPIDRAFGVDAAPAGVDLAELLPVKSQDVEAGARMDLSERGLFGKSSVDATYFRDKLSNETMEVTNSELSNPLTQFAFGSAVYNGVALSVDDVPSWHLQVHGNATFQHDYFLRYVPQGSTINYRGFPVSDSPDYTTNLGLSSYFDLGKKALVTPQVWWQYVGRRYLFSNYINAPTRQTMPGYGLVNLTLSLSLNHLGGIFGSVPLQMSFGVYNLFNKKYDPTAYITSGGYFSTSFGNYILVDPGAPREYAMSVRLDF